MESINSRLALVMKSGKYTLGYRSTLKTLRQGKVKSNTMPCLQKLEFITTLEITLNLVLPVVNTSVCLSSVLLIQEILTSFDPCQLREMLQSEMFLKISTMHNCQIFVFSIFSL